jgi:hypothetical protein
VHSDTFEHQKGQSLQRTLKRDSEAIAKAKMALERQRFDCEQDSEKALSAFLKQRGKGHYKLQGSILREETVKRNSGRPRKKNNQT